jgi:hypothetical protein
MKHRHESTCSALLLVGAQQHKILAYNLGQVLIEPAGHPPLPASGSLLARNAGEQWVKSFIGSVA